MTIDDIHRLLLPFAEQLRRVSNRILYQFEVERHEDASRHGEALERSMTAVSQNLSIVLPLRAELWSGSPTKTRLPKPADVGVKDCSPEMWCMPDGRWHKAAGLPSGAAPPWLMWWQVPNRTGAGDHIGRDRFG
jgi:hypothetical protein